MALQFVFIHCQHQSISTTNYNHWCLTRTDLIDVLPTSVFWRYSWILRQERLNERLRENNKRPHSEAPWKGVFFDFPKRRFIPHVQERLIRLFCEASSIPCCPVRSKKHEFEEEVNLDIFSHIRNRLCMWSMNVSFSDSFLLEEVGIVSLVAEVFSTSQNSVPRLLYR